MKKKGKKKKVNLLKRIGRAVGKTARKAGKAIKKVGKQIATNESSDYTRGIGPNAKGKRVALPRFSGM